MHKIKVDIKGNLEVFEVNWTDEELILFSARYLQIYDCFDSLTDAICSTVLRKPESSAEYYTVWHGWKVGEKITWVVGMRNNCGELHLHGIANALLDFQAEDLHGEMASKDEDLQRGIEEDMYYHNSKFLIYEYRHKREK